MPAVEIEDRERVSSLMDGRLHGEELARLLGSLTDSEDGRATWHAYHVVGDVLRSQELAECGRDRLFVERLRHRLLLADDADTTAVAELEPVSGASHPAAIDGTAVAARHAGRESANAALWRWRMAAIAASLATVAVLGWHLAGPSGPSGAAQLAQTQPAPAAAGVTVPPATGEPPVMLRDPKLDELLAAHKQFGGTSALQTPAGFLRNATFDQPGR